MDAVEKLLHRCDVVAAGLSILDGATELVQKAAEKFNLTVQPNTPGFFVTATDIIFKTPAGLCGEPVPADAIAEFHRAPSAKLTDADIRFARKHNIAVGTLTAQGFFVFAPRTWKGVFEHE